MKRSAAFLAALVLPLAACSGGPAPAPQGTVAGAPAPGPGVDQALARHGLQGATARQIIDRLDQTNDDRSGPLKVSVRIDHLVISSGEEKKTMPMPADQTYVSIAPYASQTHECFNHHLQSCQGEQVDKAFQVVITDPSGKEIHRSEERTYANGFVGLWLPRDLRGTLTVSGEGRTGSVPFGTRVGDPTCITTLKLDQA
ncbi:copper-binding periplasmic metallochaperone CueP [Mariniluteicoccus endophyticus]